MNHSEYFSNPALVWFLVGIGLALIELVVPGLVLLFFGIGAWIVALLCWLFDIHIALQVSIFLIASVASLMVFRKYLKSKLFSEKRNHEPNFDDEEFLGKTAQVVSEIKPGYPGKIDFKGSTWKAASDVELAVGQIVKIIDKDSITLIVKPN